MELYFHPVSFYSKKVVLALAARNIEYTARLVDLLKGESNTPEYMKMNPLGQVPVLKDGDVIIPDSSNIVRYIDNKYGDPKLFPSVDTERGKLVEEYETKLNSIDIPTVTFGSFLHPDLATDSQVPEEIRHKLAATMATDDKVRGFERAMNANPDLAEEYRAKMEGWRAKSAFISDKARVEETLVATGQVLDQVEKQLAKSGASKWMFGDDITIVDITLAITLVRFTKVGFAKRFWKDGKHPFIEKYEAKLTDYDALSTVDAFM